jgi:DNA-damage-inducible protein D
MTKLNNREATQSSILTAEILKATFGLTPSEHIEFKRLKKQNLRDHNLSRMPSG